MKVDRICLTDKFYAHGRATLAKHKSEDGDYYGSPDMCEAWRRCHSQMVWQAMVTLVVLCCWDAKNAGPGW